MDMEIHKLTDADEWFLEKGQVDSISRSRFSVGDEVVVCDRQHVMLAEFYDGKCPTCNSEKLVAFSRENVELGTLYSYIGICPKCNTNVTIMFRQHGSLNPYTGNCPNCKRKITFEPDYFTTQSILQNIVIYVEVANKVLAFLLIAMIIIVVLLNYKGMISNQDFSVYIQNVARPRTFFLAEKLQETFLLSLKVYDFLRSEVIINRFIQSFAVTLDKTRELFENGKSVAVFLIYGLQSVFLSLSDGTTRIFINSVDLFQLFKEKLESIVIYFRR